MGKRRFWGSLAGTNSAGESSTEASRGGSSGVTGHIRGWDSGIKVVGYIDAKDRDCFAIYVTAGSHGGKNDELVGILVEGEWTT